MPAMMLLGLLAVSVGLAEDLSDLTVVYTGRTLGYARACLEERLVPQPPQMYTAKRSKRSFSVTLYNWKCEGQVGYADKLEKKLLEARPTTEMSLTLGTGDHFSLDYRARVFVLERTPPIVAPKDEFHYLKTDKFQGWVWLKDFEKERRRGDFEEVIKDQASGDSEVDHDSVADFLMRAGYDALVPGEHDFYFGPERIREMARLLASKGHRMLGANMVVRGQPLEAKPSREDRLRESDYARKHETVKILLPKVVTPWWRKVKVTIPEKSSFQRLELCEAGKDVDKACESGGIEFQPDTDKAVYKLDQSEPQPLKPGAAYHVCASGLEPKIAETYKGNPKTRYCELFYVERPFLNTQLDGVPYQVFEKRKAIVFGAVAAGLEKQIGKLNTIWRHVVKPCTGSSVASDHCNEEHEVRMEAVDPLAAVSQALDYCEARRDCSAQHSRTRILLAHMPAEAAYGIQKTLGNNKFHLVITEASESQFTPLQRAYYPPDYPPLVVSPKMPYVLGTDGKIGVHAQSVRLLRKHSGGAVSEGFSEKDDWILPVTETDIVGNTVIKALEDSRIDADIKDKAAGFRTLVLHSMLRATEASIAIIQKRDLFETATRLSKSPDGVKDADDRIRAAVEGIVWKGDFLLTRLIKGSSLKQVMERSKAQDKLDADVYQERAESRLGLHTLGIFEDPNSKEWVVDGAPLENDKAYKVALTDYLAFGDTGYPELSQQLSGREQRPAELERSERISELVYRRLSAAYNQRPYEQRTSTQFWSYLDHIEWEHSPQPPHAGWRTRMADYFRNSRRPTPALPGVTSTAAIKNPETLTQVRPRWRLINEKDEFSLTFSRNNQQDQAVLLSRFQGVQDSRVTTAENTTWGTAWAVELRREKRRSMDFLRSESRFQRQEIAGKDGRFVSTYPQNDLSLEGGWRMSFTPVIHQKRWYGALVSGVWNTQFENPRIDSSYKFDKPAGADCPAGSKLDAGNCVAPFDARTGRTSRYLLKAGLRTETRDSWWEAGLFGGIARRTVAYRFLRPDREAGKSCDLRSILLSECLKGLTAPDFQASGPAQSAVMGQGLETGLFYNFNWRIPLRPDSLVQLVLENRGRLYFNNSKDFVLDTRLNNLFSAGFAIPFAGKLALKPTWSLFHFISKASVRDPVNRPAWGLTSHAVEMKLEYRFDWLEGQPWIKVLRYGAGIK